MKIRVMKSSGFMRPIEDHLPTEELPKPGDVVQLGMAPFVGHFRVDNVEPPMTGDNCHRFLPLLYVHSMQVEYGA